MSDFTPGPWGIFEPDEEMEGDFYIYSTDKDENRVSHAFTWGCASDGSDKEALPNACLIAAAPEVLEALEDLTTWCLGYEREIKNELALKKIGVAEKIIKKARAKS